MSLEELKNAVIAGDVFRAKTYTEEIINTGVSPKQVTDVLIAAMDEVARRWNQGDMFIPEVVKAANAMHAGLAVLKPLLAASDSAALGKVVIGTVKGDLHDIGKSLVRMMLEGAGFEVIDLGVDVPAERFVKVVQEQNPDIVAMSSLLTTTLPGIGETIQALTQAGMRDCVRVIVGGAVVTRAFAEKVGADGYGSDAAEAVTLCKSFISAKKGA